MKLWLDSAKDENLIAQLLRIFTKLPIKTRNVVDGWRMDTAVRGLLEHEDAELKEMASKVCCAGTACLLWFSARG